MTALGPNTAGETGMDQLASSSLTQARQFHINTQSCELMISGWATADWHDTECSTVFMTAAV